MPEQKPGFFDTIKSYPRTFWVANTMEIFERLSWYGWFTVMPLYVCAPTETGGLGFTEETRGMLQGIVPCLLYLMPVLTGAMADRYGFKKSLISAYLVMILSYYLLGQFFTLPTFFLAFLFVAVGAAIFKPVIVGTVAKVTNSSNSAMAFGIFYMMVNIGGFVGPFIAGSVRGWGWQWVFITCAAWAGVNLLIVLFLYKEPPSVASEGARTFKAAVLDKLVEVLGNLRFFLTVGVVIVGLMVASVFAALDKPWFTWNRAFLILGSWIVLNLLFDRVLPRDTDSTITGQPVRRNPLLKRMHCSNWRFALFLLIMSGFWTSFNQIFYTMPGYIRDFVDTRPLIHVAESIFGESSTDDPTKGIASIMATISDEERAVIVRVAEELSKRVQEDGLAEQNLRDGARELIDSKIRLTPERLSELTKAHAGDAQALTDQLIIQGRQVNPEFIINIDAGAIIMFQVLISFLMAKFHRFTTMVVGMLVAACGIGLSFFAGGEGMLGIGASVWIVALGLFTFAIGEMMASPTSQEFIGRIAPRDKVAMYMGYYFVAMALGNLFGGIISGELYGTFARDMQRPDLMWAAFGGIMLATAIVFLLYNRFALPKHQSHTLTGTTN